jgi:hypothetical protein
MGFAVGTALGGPSLQAFRAGVDTDGDALQSGIARLTRYKHAELVGRALKRVPAPHPADHPHGDLLRHNRIQVRWRADPKQTLHRSGFVGFCRKQLEAAGDVHRWLVRHCG